MITKDATFTISLQAMAMKKGVRLKSLNLQIHTFNIDDLIDKNTDLISGYISNEPFRLKERGYESVIFDPKEYGFDFYSDILFTTTKTIQQNPQSVKNMRDASLKGWKYAFDHIEETAKLIQKKYNIQKKSLASLIFEGEALKKLAYFKTNKLGKIDKNKIQRIYDIYNVMGYVKNPLNIHDLIFTHKENILELTKEEQEYLEKISTIKMCTLPDEMPISKIENKKFIGISADYMQLISQKLNTKFQLVPTNSWKQSLEFIKNKKCALLPIAQKTPTRKSYLSFTKSYLSSSLIIATKNDKIFVPDLEDILDKKIAIKSGFSFIELLKANYPNIKLIEVTTAKEGLQKVLDSQVYGYIGVLTTTAFEIQNNFFGKLKISGSVGEKILFKTAVRKEDTILLNILNKSIGNINQEEKHTIINKWLNINLIKGTDYTLLWRLSIFFIIIMGIIFIFIVKLNKHKKELQASKEQIHQYMNVMLDGFAIMKIDTQEIVFCNKIFEEITGYSLKELNKISIHKIYPKNALPYIMKELKKQELGHISTIPNVPILNKNGNIAIYDVDMSIVTINNTIFYYGNFRSMSEKVQAENNLRQENKKLRQKLLEYGEHLN